MVDRLRNGVRQRAERDRIGAGIGRAFHGPAVGDRPLLSPATPPDFIHGGPIGRLLQIHRGVARIPLTLFCGLHQAEQDGLHYVLGLGGEPGRTGAPHGGDDPPPEIFDEFIAEMAACVGLFAHLTPTE